MAAAGFGAQLAEAVRSSVPGDYRRIRAGRESIREALDAEGHGLQPMPGASPVEWHLAGPGCRDFFCPGDCSQLAGIRLADDR